MHQKVKNTLVCIRTLSIQVYGLLQRLCTVHCTIIKNNFTNTALCTWITLQCLGFYFGIWCCILYRNDSKTLFRLFFYLNEMKRRSLMTKQRGSFLMCPNHQGQYWSAEGKNDQRCYWPKCPKLCIKKDYDCSQRSHAWIEDIWHIWWEWIKNALLYSI